LFGISSLWVITFSLIGGVLSGVIINYVEHKWTMLNKQ
jgi:hypothetical protein